MTAVLEQWATAAQDMALQYLQLLKNDENNSALPGALLLLVTPFHVHRLTRRAAFGDIGPVVVIKALLLLFGATFELSTAALLRAEPDFRAANVFYSPIVCSLANLCCAVIAWAEYCYAVKPTLMATAYLASSAVLDAHRAATYFGQGKLEGLSLVAVPIIGIKLFVIALEEIPKLFGSHPQKGRNGEPLRTGAMRYRERCRWLYAMFLALIVGANTRDEIPDMTRDFSSQQLYAKFTSQWTKQDKSAKNALARVCLSALPLHYHFAALARLCLSAFALMQPYVVNRILYYLGATDGGDNLIPTIIATTMVVYFGISMCKSAYMRLVNYTAVCLRGMLSTALYNKTLTLAQSQCNMYKAVTILNTDLNTLGDLVTSFNDIWASAFEVACGAYILYLSAGFYVVWALVPICFSVWLNSKLERPMRAAHSEWDEKVRERVASTSTVLQQLTTIRASGLTLPVLEHLEKLKEMDIRASRKHRRLRMTRRIIIMFSESLVPAIVVLCASLHTSSAVLSVNDLFTIFVTIAILVDPFKTALRGPASIRRGLQAVQRIQQFLCLDEFHSSRNVDESEISEQPSFSNAQYSIDLTDITVTFENGKQVFDNLTLQFLPGQVSMLIGPTGAGKSTLLKVILGEVVLEQGHLSITTESIAYCGQEAWIQNVSIHDNILGRGRCETPWYITVINACRLNQDIRELEEGDETIAGFDGCNFTESQKQRIALARAVYSRPSVLLLDGTLNSMDAKTAAKILDNLLGESGILRQSRTTVIMTTNISDDLAMADKVYHFNQNGAMRAIKTNVDDEVNEQLVRRCVKPREEWQAQEEGLTYGVNERESNITFADPERPIPSPYSQSYFDIAGWMTVSVWFLLAGMAAFAQRWPAIYARSYLDFRSADIHVVFGIVKTALATFLATVLNLAYYYSVVIPAGSRNVHQQLVETVLCTTLWFTTMLDRKELLKRFDEDMRLVASCLPDIFMDITYSAVTLPIDVVIIGVTTTLLAPLLPFMFLSIYVTGFFCIRNFFTARSMDLKARETLYTHFVDTMNGLHHIRAFGWKQRFKQHNLGLLDTSQHPYYFLLCNYQGFCLLMDLTVMGIATVMASTAYYAPESCPTHALGLAFVALTLLGQRICWFARFAVELEVPMGAMTRIQNFCVETPFEVDKRASANAYFAREVDKTWSSIGRLELRSVNAPFNPSDATSSLALSNVRICIEPGTKVLITGPAGSGKSSLLLAMQNFFDYTGSITIDGRDIRGIARHILRKNILAISHQGVLLEGTLRHNLDPHRIANQVTPSRRLSDDAVIVLLRRIALWPYIEARGGTLESSVSDLELGADQKQLISIARLLLRKMRTGTSLVLLDGPTDYLDPETADAVEVVMDEVLSNCTVLSVSHRPQAESKADAVVKMRSGRIVGTYSQGESVDMDPYAFMKNLPWLSPSLRHRINMAYVD